MYNYNELQAVELSPTKKDYYQIWNELMDVAGKLSARWDPTATNESDPGIVLLKVLTAIADKLNYNIDANTLETFMPSAAQESSMRKLCEMLGYNMRYYQSATTTVRITYKGDVFPQNPSTQARQIEIDRFTNIKDKNSTVNFITLEPIRLTPSVKSATVECIEGELVTCQTDNGTTITLSHLDDNNRFYLPEQQVASNTNGIFISNIGSEYFWDSTDNLNTNLLGSYVYKFGYDSARALPYVQFPEDIGALIGSGIQIKFLRTQGASGNISVNLLQSLEKPASWQNTTTTTPNEVSAAAVIEEQVAEDFSWTNPEEYSVTNIVPARNGKNPETIDEAYWNYQKTIGTFDTLVTCRDYMNKIYQMTKTDVDTTPLVSNVIVSDIRDDINRAYTICTYTDQGVEYARKPHLVTKEGQTAQEERIKYFDLVLYPFETVYGLNNQAEFLSSFTYSDKFISEIKSRLKSNKTMAHKFNLPDKEDDIICLKIYTQLSARLSTTYKVSALEAIEIEAAAHNALYSEYNLRKLSFGEEIPYDSILKTLTLADPRIKNVILDDPKFTVVAYTFNGEEIPIISDQIYANEAAAEKALNIYKKLVLNNVLAGKIPLFNYNTTFANNFTDIVYPEGSSNLDSSSSIRGKDDSESNPSNITAYSSINSKQTYIEKTPGTLTISLSSTNTDQFSTFAAYAKPLSLALYAKGASSPEYTIKYFLNDLTDGASALVPTIYQQGIAVSSTNITKDPEANTLSVSGAFKVLASISKETLDKNSSSLIVGNLYLNNLFDKAVLMMSYPYELGELAEDALEAFTFSFSFESDESASTSEETFITYPTFFDPKTASSYITLENGNLKEEGVTEDKPFPTPTKISSDLRINTDNISKDNPFVLTAGEVVQFRAPNFKTTSTYPAYVNYFAKLDTDEIGRATTLAVPATMQALYEFFGGGEETESSSNFDSFYITARSEIKEGYEKPDVFVDEWVVHGTNPPSTTTWNRRTSWETKVRSLPEGIMTKIYTTETALKENYSEREANEKYKTLKDQYKAIFVKYNGSVTNENKNKGDYVLFNLPDDIKDSAYIPNGLEFYVVNITEENFVSFMRWLQGQTTKQLQYTTSKGVMLSGVNLITSLYTKGKSNLTRKPGKLVDRDKFKYDAVESLAYVGYAALTTYFVPELWDTPSKEHTTDGLGQDAKAGGIPANAEYQLGPQEYVLLTYSTSEGREDGSTVVKNVALGPGSIIKTNFELLDSTEKSAVNKFSKTNNYGPWTIKNTLGSILQVIKPEDIPGMYAFGANEQLEVREPIVVELDGPVTNLYWEVNNPVIRTVAGVEREYFPFDNETNAYILQAGEYLFYTDAAQESLAYYGAGTEIRANTHTPPLYKKATTSKISLEKASETGLVASFPWTPFNLSAKNAQLTISEYQTINLAEGDSLYSITYPKEAEQTSLSNKFVKVLGADYKVLGSEGSLPTLAIDNYFWEARGKLEIATSAELPLQLNVQRTKAGAEIARDYLMLHGENADGIEQITQVFTPLVSDSEPARMLVYSDTPLIAADGNYWIKSDNIPTFKICSSQPLVAKRGTGNEKEETDYAPVYNQAGLAEYDLALGNLDLNTLIPEDSFGLLTIHLLESNHTMSKEETSEDEFTVSLISSTPLSIFNNYGSSDLSAAEKEEDIINEFAWWDEMSDSLSGTYTLKTGLNIVCIPSSCTITLSAVGAASESILLGQLKLVPKQNQLNPQLAFESHNSIKIQDRDYDTRLHFKYFIGETSFEKGDLTVSTKEVYQYIKELTSNDETRFFYTHEPSNTSGLDLNDLDPTDTLALPKNWFDAQNLANKFVISELDAGYLNEYIAVSKFSRS